MGADACGLWVGVGGHCVRRAAFPRFYSRALANVRSTNFVTEVVDDGKGALFSKVVKVIPNVNQTLGYDPAVFAKIGLPSRTVPECKKY